MTGGHIRKDYNVNRSERLTHILEFLKRGMSFSIDEIVKKYDVSGRTVFRDIKTLKKLGYKVDFDFDNGYKLANSTESQVFKKLSDLQLELISFALKTHPLKQILPLIELSDKICDSIINHSQIGFFKAPDHKQFNSKRSFFAKTSKDEVKLSSFIKAVEQDRLVHFKTKSGKFTGQFRPAGIIFGSNSIKLLVRDDSRSVQSTLKRYSEYQNYCKVRLQNCRFDLKAVENLVSGGFINYYRACQLI